MKYYVVYNGTDSDDIYVIVKASSEAEAKEKGFKKFEDLVKHYDKRELYSSVDGVYDTLEECLDALGGYTSLEKALKDGWYYVE